MKKLLIAGAAVAALIGTPALAADLARPVYKAPPAPPPAPVANWTGCYIDAGIGYGMWRQDHFGETLPPLPVVDLTAGETGGGSGWLGRFGAGCDYQIGSQFVIGAFGDYDVTGLSGTFHESLSGFPLNEKEQGEWAVGGRIGYLVTPTLLTYVDGGYTQARFDQMNFPAPLAFLAMPAHTYPGWFFGGGVEYNLGWFQGLAWRTEYRYAQFSATDLPIIFTPTGATLPLGDHINKSIQTATTGLVWHFNFGGAVGSRY